MSFNVEDPLAGILSDGSDDSFFDDDVLGKKKPVKKISTPSAEKKNSLFDLESKPKSSNKTEAIFNEKSVHTGANESRKLSDNDSTKPSSSKLVSKDAMDSKSNSIVKLDTSKSPSKSKTGSHGALDILGELGLNKNNPKPLEKGKSSQSLLDDILGGPLKTGGSSQTTRPTTAAKSDFGFDSILGKSEPKKNPAGKNAPLKQNAIVDNAKKSEESTKKKTNEDWLGIFQEDEKSEEADNEDGMPDWLAGGDKKKKTETAKKLPKDVSQKSVPLEEHVTRTTEVVGNTDVNLDHINISQTIPGVGLLQTNNEDIAAEGAALYMQQQESQLMIALQLKAQEEKLATLQMRQKESQRVHREAALAQTSQLDAMLQRQASHRQQMQAIISAHQARITQRIKALLGNADVEGDDIIHHDDEPEKAQGERIETPHTREKKQLLQLVQSLQENHDKEIDLMETSYRRQLAFVEISLSQSEERMKEESEKLIKFYSEKIVWLEEHHQLYKKITEENLNAMMERHKDENEMLRRQHFENIRVLQENHASLMENIKKAVKQEQVLIQDSAGFSSDLLELVANVKENKSQCQILVDKVQALTENSQRDNDRSLQTREIQINDMIQQLKKEKENFESEKSETRDIVKMLENRLKQMTVTIEEDAAAMKQKKMEFEFERATFSKQTEFAKNVLKKQDEEMKMLKEESQKEYQEKIAKVDEERKKAIKETATLAKEKAAIHSIKQELDIMKADLQAQLEEVRDERSKLNVEKQQIHMEEQRNLAKFRDLDLLAKTAMDKQTQADKKYSEAEFLQRKYDDRIRRIQEHVVSLNTREKQIAREKVALSRERLSLHNERKQIESRQQCSLCKSAQYQHYEPNYNLPETFLNIPVSRDYGQDIEANSAMNAIEQEMAFLMSRNFNLRHSTANVGNLERRAEEKHGGDEDFSSAQPESGPLKDYMDPKFMMLRLDVKQVLSNLDQKKDDNEESQED